MASIEITEGTASVTNGESVITLADTIDLFVGDSAYFIVSGGGSVGYGRVVGSTGSNSLQLAIPWRFPTITNGDFTLFNALEGLSDAVRKLGLRLEEVQEIRDNFELVLTSTDESITIPLADGDVQVRPWGNVTQEADTTLQGLAPAIIDGDRRTLESASGGKNTIIYDAQGNPNVMVVVPRFNYEDLGLPLLELGSGTPTAFLTDGAPRSEILIGKYLASSAAGGTAVVGGVQPRVNVNFDTAKDFCTQKGDDWHLMSIHEWAAIALWSLANGTVPRGNTNYGRSHENNWETSPRGDGGIPGDTDGTGRTDTGKGPAAWGHDHTDFGIQDLVGNVWEWIDQMKLQDGRIITTLDNNPAVAEANWTGHQAYYDSTSETGGSPILNSTVANRMGDLGDDANTGNSNSLDFSALTKDPSYTPLQLLRQLLLETATAETAGGRLYTRNYGERLPLRGGSWYNGSAAGLGALNLTYSRSVSNSFIGFRPAFFV